MEELFFGLIGVAVVIAPLWALIANISRTRRLEREMQILRQRFDILEKKTVIASENVPVSKSIPAHQLATLIDLETLRTEAQSAAHSSEYHSSEPLSAQVFEQSSSPAGESEPNLQAEQTITPSVKIAQEQASSNTENKSATEQTISSPKTNTEWEALIGGRLFNRIGAAAIVIGMGFFLKYAFDNDLISEPMRVLLGVIAGGLLLLFGERLQSKKLPIFAQGLTGAGIGTLYLSVYAAYNFYHLVPILQAFAGMIGVTVIGFVMALRYNALAIALLAWFGGYCTPLLIHSEQPNPFGLMSYLTILSLGMLLLVLRRDDWFVLKPLSFLATYSICGLWYSNAYTTMEHFGMTVSFAVLFWAIFFGVDFYRAVSGRSITDVWWWRIDSFLNSSLSYTALFALIYDAYPRWMPLVSLCYGAVYFVAGQIIRLRKPEHTFAFMRYTLTAIVQMVFATAQQFNDEYTLMVWSVEFVFLLWAGLRWKHGFVGFAGLLLSFWTFAAFFLIYSLASTSANAATIDIDKGILHIVMIVAFFVGALLEERLETMWIIEKLKDKVSKLQTFSTLRLGFALCVGYFFAYLFAQFSIWNNQHTIEHSQYWYRMFHASGYCLCAVSLAIVAKWRSWREPAFMAVVVLLLMSVMLIINGFAYEPAIQWSFLLNVRVISLLIALGALIAFWFVYDASNTMLSAKIIPFVRPALGASGFFLVFTLLSGEASDAFHSQIMRLYALPEAIQVNAVIVEKISGLENAKQLAISLIWLAYAAVLMAVGFARRIRIVRLVALGLAGVAILKIFLYDLSYLTTPYRIGSFIGLGVVLMLVSYLYQRFKDRII